MKLAEFAAMRVYAAWVGADLSDGSHKPGDTNPDPKPAWPSRAYMDAFYAMRKQLAAPPRGEPTTVEQLVEAADAMFEMLASAQAPDPVIAQRWELAGQALLDAKAIAKATAR